MRGTNKFIRGLTNTAFMYKGSYDSIPKSGSDDVFFDGGYTQGLHDAWAVVRDFINVHKIGDVIIVDGAEYVYSKTGWTDTGARYGHPQRMIPKTCTQCGAVLRGSVCEYCGTMY